MRATRRAERSRCQIGRKRWAEMRPLARSISPAGHVLGRKLDSIPFSPYHMMLIAVLALVGFVDGYDLVMTGSLLVLAKEPLHLGPSEIRFLAIASTMMICVGGFIASAISDHYSRKDHHADRRGQANPLYTAAHVGPDGRAADYRGSADRSRWRICGLCAVPDRRRLARHRRTFSAVYEMALACSFAVLPLVGRLLADSPNAFRLMALPGGLASFIVPVLIYFLIPESPRRYLRRGLAEAAVDTVNRIIRGAGSRVPPLALATLGDNMQVAREELPPYRVLFHRGHDSHRRADDRIHRPVGRDRLPDLPLRAVLDGAARARTCLWGQIFSGVLAPFLMAPYTGSPAIFFWHDIGRGDDRRLHTANLWPRDREATRNGYRASSGPRLRRERISRL